MRARAPPPPPPPHTALNSAPRPASRSGRVNNSAIAALAHGCAGLCSIDIGWCEVGDEALEELAHSCPELTTV